MPLLGNGGLFKRMQCTCHANHRKNLCSAKGQPSGHLGPCIFITMLCVLFVFFVCARLHGPVAILKVGQGRRVFYRNGVLKDIDREINSVELYCIRYSER